MAALGEIIRGTLQEILPRISRGVFKATNVDIAEILRIPPAARRIVSLVEKGEPIVNTLKRTAPEAAEVLDRPSWVVIPVTEDKKPAGVLAQVILGRNIESQQKGLPLYSKIVKEYTANPQAKPVHVLPDERVILLPTRPSATEKSSTAVLERNLDELKKLIDVGEVRGPILMPRVGSGAGGLEWDDVVKPIIQKKLVDLPDDTFVVVSHLKDMPPDVAAKMAKMGYPTARIPKAVAPAPPPVTERPVEELSLVDIKVKNALENIDAILQNAKKSGLNISYRAAATGEPGYDVFVPPDKVGEVYRVLVEHGKGLSMVTRPGGKIEIRIPKRAGARVADVTNMVSSEELAALSDEVPGADEVTKLSKTIFNRLVSLYGREPDEATREALDKHSVAMASLLRSLPSKDPGKVQEQLIARVVPIIQNKIGDGAVFRDLDDVVSGTFGWVYPAALETRKLRQGMKHLPANRWVGLARDFTITALRRAGYGIANDLVDGEPVVRVFKSAPVETVKNWARSMRFSPLRPKRLMMVYDRATPLPQVWDETLSTVAEDVLGRAAVYGLPVKGSVSVFHPDIGPRKIVFQITDIPQHLLGYKDRGRVIEAFRDYLKTRVADPAFLPLRREELSLGPAESFWVLTSNNLAKMLRESNLAVTLHPHETGLTNYLKKYKETIIESFVDSARERVLDAPLEFAGFDDAARELLANLQQAAEAVRSGNPSPGHRKLLRDFNLVLSRVVKDVLKWWSDNPELPMTPSGWGKAVSDNPEKAALERLARKAVIRTAMEKVTPSYQQEREASRLARLLADISVYGEEEIETFKSAEGYRIIDILKPALVSGREALKGVISDALAEAGLVPLERSWRYIRVKKPSLEAAQAIPFRWNIPWLAREGPYPLAKLSGTREGVEIYVPTLRSVPKGEGSAAARAIAKKAAPLDNLILELSSGVRLEKDTGVLRVEYIPDVDNIANNLKKIIEASMQKGKEPLSDPHREVINKVVARILENVDPTRAPSASNKVLVERLGMLAYASNRLANDVDSLIKKGDFGGVPDRILKAYLEGNKDAEPAVMQAARKFAEAASRLERAARDTVLDIMAKDPDVKQYVVEQAKTVKELSQLVDGYTLGLGLIPMNLFKRTVQPDTKLAAYEYIAGTNNWTKLPMAFDITKEFYPAYFVLKHHPLTNKLYSIRRQLDNNRAIFIRDWREKWAELWRGVHYVNRTRILEAVEGKLDPKLLSPEEKALLYRYKEMMARLAEVTVDPGGVPVKHRVGDIISISVPGRQRRVKARILSEDLDSWTYTLEYRDSPKSTKQITVNISEVDRAMEYYFPHRFKGNWVVYYPKPENEGYKLSIFTTLENALDYILENRDWKPSTGLTFREYLLRTYKKPGMTDAEAIQAGLEAEKVVLHARWLIPSGFDPGMTPAQIGTLARNINQEIADQLKSAGIDPKAIGLTGRQIFGLIRQAGVTMTTGAIPPRRVSATLPRTANLLTYIGNPDDAFTFHIWQTSSQMLSNNWRKAVRDILGEFYKTEIVGKGGVDKNAIKLFTFADKWARDVDSYTPSFLDEFLQSLGLTETQALNVMRKASSFMSAFKLFSLVSPLVNLTQTAVTTYPVLGAKYTIKGIELLGKFWRTRDPELKQVLEKAGAHVFAPAYSLDVYVGASMKRESSDFITGLMLMPFQLAETANRSIAVLGAYARAKDMGHPDPIKVAMLVADRTQGEYSKVGTAKLLRSPTMSLVFQFKKFFALYVSFIADIVDRILRGSDSALNAVQRASRAEFDPAATEFARWVVASTAAGGVLSMPFVAVLDKLMVQWYGYSPIDEARKRMPPPAYDLVMRGVPSIFGVDMTGRVGIGRDIDNILRGAFERGFMTADMLVDLSPWASVIMQTYEAMLDVLKYGDDWAVDRLLSQLSPSAFWYLYYALKQRGGGSLLGFNDLTGKPSVYMFEPGVYSHRRGAKIIDPPDDDPMFWIKKMLGFQSPVEMDAYRALWLADTFRDHYDLMKNRYLRIGVRLYLEGDEEGLAKLIEDAMKNGVDISIDRIKEEIKRRRSESLQRYYERTPKPLRPYVQSIIERYTGEEPLGTTMPRIHVTVPRPRTPSLERRP